MRLKTMALEKIRPYERNPRINDQAVDAVAESIRQCGYVAPIIVDENNVILAGHTRWKALRQLGEKTARVCVAEGLDEEQKRKYRILDNKTGELADWDRDLLNIELDGLDFDGFDFDLLELTDAVDDQKTVHVSDYDRRKAAAEDAENEEIREAAWAEDVDEDTPEYQAFVEKFKPKKTTDDCYTPEPVYEAIADFVAKQYSVERSRFVRPFYPGGDYQAFAYEPDAIVVDNPPFSILSKIVTWYTEHSIRFFLFAPTLTLFSGSSAASCAALPVGVAITYENGANVSTSFLTNLEPEDIRVHTLPELYKTVETANNENLRQQHKQLPKYIYPDEVLTAAAAYRLCKYGHELILKKDDTERIGELDAQKEYKVSIFGSGYLLSERAAAERAKAERETPVRNEGTTWKLSDREREIVRSLGHGV